MESEIGVLQSRSSPHRRQAAYGGTPRGSTNLNEATQAIQKELGEIDD